MKTRMLLVVTALLAVAALGYADEISRDSILTTFERGGGVMWAILLVSIYGCWYAVERIISLLRAVQIPKRLMDDMREAMMRGGVAAGRKLVEGKKSAMAKIMYTLLSRSGATRRELEAVLDEEGTRILFDMRKNLRPIGVAAIIAPQLGLLGTVFGLIAAFRAAAELGMDDPRNFAAGIYEALYTTAFGLVVGIPFLLIYNWLRTKADAIVREVEERALAFISAASNRAEMARREVDNRSEPASGFEDGDSLNESTTVDDGPGADSEDTSVQEL
ncbi:MAG: MotA/TolQ/ExbB proton channel family protein [Planctomycetota bacterium]|jgi:biopolymer transport protein ExbB|nr:MotA/TolQ/ExbB proton channel family protein [Planctomycetota bacterium]